MGEVKTQRAADDNVSDAEGGNGLNAYRPRLKRDACILERDEDWYGNTFETDVDTVTEQGGHAAGMTSSCQKAMCVPADSHIDPCSTLFWALGDSPVALARMPVPLGARKDGRMRCARRA